MLQKYRYKWPTTAIYLPLQTAIEAHMNVRKNVEIDHCIPSQLKHYLLFVEYEK